MERIATSTRAVDLFGAGKDGYKNGDPQAGEAATELSADALNAIQEELAGIIETADLTLSAADKTQLTQAVGLLIRGWLPEYTSEFGKPRLFRSTQYGNERDTWYAYEQVDGHLNQTSGNNLTSTIAVPSNTHFFGTARIVIARTDSSAAEAGYMMVFHGKNVAGTAAINHEDLLYGDDGGLAISSVYMDFSSDTIKVKALLGAVPGGKKYNMNVHWQFSTVTRYAP